MLQLTFDLYGVYQIRCPLNKYDKERLFNPESEISRLTRQQNIHHPSCRRRVRRVKGVLVQSSREAKTGVKSVNNRKKIEGIYLGKTTQRERFGLEIANFVVHTRSLIGID